MKKNIAKNYVRKIVTAVFCLVMLVYGQCGYAVIEKYLTPVAPGLYKLGSEDSPVKIDTIELATEIIGCLQSGLLKMVHIGYWYRIPILKPLIQSLYQNIALTRLDLRHNYFGSEGARIIADALKLNTRLNWLELHQNNIGDEGACVLAEVLHSNPVLSTLILRYDSIGDIGARAIAGALQYNNVLTTLSIRDNNIGHEGAKAIAQALRHNATLSTLNLRGNNIGDEGTTAIAESIHNNRALTTLILCGNNIGDIGAKAIANTLRYNIALITLNIRSNNIGVRGAEALAEALRCSTILSTLDLQFNDISDEGAKAIHEALIDNYNMLVFKHSFDNGENDKILLRNYLLVKLLHKIKQASAFTFVLGIRNTPLRHVIHDILGFAGLDVLNQPIFENIQNYNNERTRDVIFRGSLENVIRLFYYGNNYNYTETLREINQIRQIQIDILRENHRAIPEGLMELPENLLLSNSLLEQGERRQQHNLVSTIFWTTE